MDVALQDVTFQSNRHSRLSYEPEDRVEFSRSEASWNQLGAELEKTSKFTFAELLPSAGTASLASGRFGH